MSNELKLRGVTSMPDTSGPLQAGPRSPAGTSMYSRSLRRILVLTLAATVSLLAAAHREDAHSGPISNQHIIADLDFSRGQTPENLALEPDGSADVTFAEAAQVARVSLDGKVRILAQLPAPTGGAACPFLGPFLGKAAFTGGIVRDHHGSLYVALCTGSPDLQGIWRVSQNGSASRIAALPADGIPNGMALDERHGFIYLPDSLLSTRCVVAIADRTVVAWASGPQLAPRRRPGANGLKLHGGAAWVRNPQLGTMP